MVIAEAMFKLRAQIIKVFAEIELPSPSIGGSTRDRPARRQRTEVWGGRGATKPLYGFSGRIRDTTLSSSRGWPR